VTGLVIQLPEREGVPLFTSNFLNLDPGLIAEAISKDGVFASENALTSEAIAAIVKDVADAGSGFNQNKATGVYYQRQFYNCHMLAVSRTFTQLVTHPKVFELIERVVGPEYRLKALRYYETYGSHHMQWHTDNKTDRGFAEIPGIIFIAYISDVADGEFQYIKGSHKWSGEKAYNDYSDAFVDDNLSRDILSFKGRAGTVVIYDTYGIHRAKPVTGNDFVRKSLFWQVDRQIEQGEPLLINPEYLDVIDERIRRYLGFGLPTEYHRFPQTDVNSLLAEDIPRGDLVQLLSRVMHGSEPLPIERVFRCIPNLPLSAFAREFASRYIGGLVRRIARRRSA